MTQEAIRRFLNKGTCSSAPCNAVSVRFQICWDQSKWQHRKWPLSMCNTYKKDLLFLRPCKKQEEHFNSLNLEPQTGLLQEF